MLTVKPEDTAEKWLDKSTKEELALNIYLRNDVIGGITPVTGFHVTIDKPELVRRVKPPTTIIVIRKYKLIFNHLIIYLFVFIILK